MGCQMRWSGVVADDKACLSAEADELEDVEWPLIVQQRSARKSLAQSDLIGSRRCYDVLAICQQSSREFIVVRPTFLRVAG